MLCPSLWLCHSYVMRRCVCVPGRAIIVHRLWRWRRTTIQRKCAHWVICNVYWWMVLLVLLAKIAKQKVSREFELFAISKYFVYWTKQKRRGCGEKRSPNQILVKVFHIVFDANSNCTHWLLLMYLLMLLLFFVGKFSNWIENLLFFFLLYISLLSCSADAVDVYSNWIMIFTF